MVQPVPETISFPAEEEKILQLWKELDVFQSCLKQSKGKPRYSFYDGPPFATGMPHYGHLLTGSIKDIVTRYAHQSGYHVERRFGWDTHGLPVEYEIDKTLGIKGPDDVEKMGIANYNAECRKIVMRYAKEWELVVGRLGRWMDFENDYKTMYPWYMESVWWAFKQLFDKGLVYKGFKVMPFSTACNTPLSNFESGQNYKDVVDPSVIVSFPLEDEPEVSLVAWTTTPWTLPSNLALVVNPEIDYVKVRDVATEKIFVLMEARLDALFKIPQDYVVIERFKGIMLRDKRYIPLFSYFDSFKTNGAFRVLNDTYVTEESGTGVVHSSPFFGEDDFRVCLAAGIIFKDGDVACPVDPSGRFVDPVLDFKGEYVKDADKNIIKWLKNAGRLVHQGTVKHSYPFCWRSDTPLIYKAVPSWFIRVEVLIEKLLETNDKTYWVPAFVKDKRFANWLKDARDWAVSRSRYWGTPIPIWSSEDGKEIVCIGSIGELEELTGSKVSDLHREFIDHLTIPSANGTGVLHRVPEVFDCWFESGSMPYAQVHYPFENKKEFEESFPADFVAEGIDQTRGWFYTLQVLATALFGQPAFKNLIANGLILASDGQKMSKRKNNYPNPLDVIGRYGADALRLYLINSPAVRADTLRFKEEGVRDVLKDIFLPWYNAYRFLVQNIQRVEQEEGVQFRYIESNAATSHNIMDRWIMSYMQSLVSCVKNEMAAYKLYNVVPQLVKFVDNLTNWYVRVSRRRLKGEDSKEDCVKALNTLFSVLFTMTRVMAPFTPFLTEHIYQNLRHLVDSDTIDNSGYTSSIHYLLFPQLQDCLIHKQTERAVARMQAVIELGRVIRDRRTLPIKYPLPEVVVINNDQEYLEDIKSLEKYILLELNVRTLTMTTDKEKYGVILRAEPDHKTLGARLKSAFKPLVQAIKDLSDDQLQNFLKKEEIEIQGHLLGPDDIRIMYSFSGEKSKDLADTYEADGRNEVLVMLNVKADKSMVDEGVAREVINRIQKLKKKLKLVPLDQVTIFYSVSPAMDPLAAVVLSHKEYIQTAIRSPLQPLPHPHGLDVITDQNEQLKGAELKLVIIRDSMDEVQKASSQTESCIQTDESLSCVSATNEFHNASAPFCRYVNVMLCGTFAKESLKGTQLTVLLENPTNSHILDFQCFVRQVQIASGLQGRVIKLVFASGNRQEIDSTIEMATLHGKLVYALQRHDTVTDCLKASNFGDEIPFSQYVNVSVDSEKNGSQACVLLENPQGTFVVDSHSFKEQVAAIFQKPQNTFKLYTSVGKKCELSEEDCLSSLHGKTVQAVFK